MPRCIVTQPQQGITASGKPKVASSTVPDDAALKLQAIAKNVFSTFLIGPFVKLG
jgi:hypothetical protein